MPRYLVEAVVLKSINYQDTDRIVFLFTREKGKILVSARGVRKISSKRGGNLDTLNHISASISEGNNKKYKIVTEVTTTNSFKNLKKSLKNSARGFYIVELVDKLLDEGQVNEKAFDLLVESLQKMDSSLNNEVSRVNHFEIKLMQLLGYEMVLDRCSKTQKKYDGSWKVVKYNPSFGGFVSGPTAPGITLNKQTADLLYELKTKDNITKKLLEDKKVVQKVDEIIKSFVSDVLEDSTKTMRVFGQI